MNKHKKLLSWLAVLLFLGLMIGVIIWNLKQGSSNIITVFLVIVSLGFTFSLQFAITRTFRFKPKPKKYVSDSFEFDLDKTLSNLEENKFVKRNTNSGYSYTKIVDKTAFKVTFIISAEKYLEQSEQGKGSSIKGLNQCDKFIGFEVFLDSNEKILSNVCDFSFNGKNLYYEAFYIDVESGLLIEPNIIKIEDSYVEEVKKFKEILNLTK